MKNWNNAAIEELGVEKTAQGKHVAMSFDEIRVDQNGQYWVSFASGVDSQPETKGEVEVVG